MGKLKTGCLGFIVIVVNDVIIVVVVIDVNVVIGVSAFIL